MLKDSFFKETFHESSVVSKNGKGESSFTSTLVINKEHAIFKGHFPDLPVVPGVCMMRIIKELLRDKLQSQVQLQSAANIKFLSLINPLENSEVEVEIKYAPAEDETWLADGTISAGGKPYFKLVRAVFK